MSHFQQQKFLYLAVGYFGLGVQKNLAVLEIGSYDVNGSIRSLFDTEHYVGVGLVLMWWQTGSQWIIPMPLSMRCYLAKFLSTIPFGRKHLKTCTAC